jgi:DNA-binding transcriptional regulator YiaG
VAESGDTLRRWSNAAYRLRTIPPDDRRKIRDLAGVSRVVLADLLGVSPERVRAYENETHPSYPTGEDAARYLDALDAMRAPYATDMDAAMRADMRARFDQHQRDYPVGVCQWCGGVHPRACPRVKRIVYNENRQVTEVEYFPDGAWPKGDIVFPDGPEMMVDDDQG